MKPLFLSIFLFAFLLSVHTAKYFPELQKVLDATEYDPDCVFNYTVVNSVTIKKFPKCDAVYAILVINNNTDLTVVELKKGFSKIKTLHGGVRIENTTYQNISFFTPPKDGEIDMSVANYGFFVRNNAELTDPSMLWEIWWYLDQDYKEVELRIENNPKLDAKFMCDYGWLSYYTEMIVQGNMRDCACPGGALTSATITRIANCESVFNGIQLHNITDAVDLSPFASVQFIRGIIDIQNTNLQNLSFLSNLGDFKVNNYEDQENIIFNLKNNPQMTRLGIPYLMEIQNVWEDGIKLANFENLHPDFCLTVKEMGFLLEQKVSFVNLHAKICEEIPAKIHDTVICKFESMGKLPSNCNLIIGDLVINYGDEENFLKLENIMYLFGSLFLQNTTLTDIEMLYKLRYIAQLNDSHPVIQVVGNQKLERLLFRDIENLVTRGKRNAVIQDNNKDLFQYQDGECAIFEKTDYVSQKYRMNLDYRGGHCGKKIQIEYRYTSGIYKFTMVSSLTLVLMKMFDF